MAYKVVKLEGYKYLYELRKGKKVVARSQKRIELEIKKKILEKRK